MRTITCIAVFPFAVFLYTEPSVSEVNSLRVSDDPNRIIIMTMEEAVEDLQVSLIAPGGTAVDNRTIEILGRSGLHITQQVRTDISTFEDDMSRIDGSFIFTPARDFLHPEASRFFKMEPGLNFFAAEEIISFDSVSLTRNGEAITSGDRLYAIEDEPKIMILVNGAIEYGLSRIFVPDIVPQDVREALASQFRSSDVDFESMEVVDSSILSDLLETGNAIILMTNILRYGDMPVALNYTMRSYLFDKAVVFDRVEIFRE